MVQKKKKRKKKRASIFICVGDTIDELKSVVYYNGV